MNKTKKGGLKLYKTTKSNPKIDDFERISVALNDIISSKSKGELSSKFQEHNTNGELIRFIENTLTFNLPGSPELTLTERERKICMNTIIGTFELDKLKGGSLTKYLKQAGTNGEIVYKILKYIVATVNLVNIKTTVTSGEITITSGGTIDSSIGIEYITLIIGSVVAFIIIVLCIHRCNVRDLNTLMAQLNGNQVAPQEVIRTPTIRQPVLQQPVAPEPYTPHRILPLVPEPYDAPPHRIAQPVRPPLPQPVRPPLPEPGVLPTLEQQIALTRYENQIAYINNQMFNTLNQFAIAQLAQEQNPHVVLDVRQEQEPEQNPHVRRVEFRENLEDVRLIPGRQEIQRPEDVQLEGVRLIEDHVETTQAFRDARRAMIQDVFGNDPGMLEIMNNLANEAERDEVLIQGGKSKKRISKSKKK